MEYIEFLSKNKYPEELVNIARGLVEVPNFTVQAPADLSFGFPPVLIPLWSNASWPGYIGIAKHWLGERSDTFVQFYSDEYSFVEIARNLNQLKAWMVFDFLCNVPAPNEVGRFSESIGFCKSSEVENIFANCEDVSDLGKLDVFKIDIPAVIERGEYLGEPEWLLKSSGVGEIDGLVFSGQYEKAWYQLNSGVFDKLEVLEILNTLSLHVGNKKSSFQDFISCWSRGNL